MITSSLLTPAMFDPAELTLPRCKAMLAELQHWLELRFKAGDDIFELVVTRSQHMDQLLTGLWQHLGLDKDPKLALVAVGGYGRGELHPFSDIDLLILCEDPANASVNERIGRFITVLWDLRLEVGHSVRSVAECIRQGEQDLTIATNLIEARLITGCYHTFAKLTAATEPDKFWSSQAFLKPSAKNKLSAIGNIKISAINWSQTLSTARVACVIFKPSAGSPVAILVPPPCMKWSATIF